MLFIVGLCNDANRSYNLTYLHKNGWKRMTTILLATLFVFSISAQSNYYMIDGDNCDEFGNSPEWGAADVADPPNDSSAAGSDMTGWWYNYDEDTDEFCFAFERFATQTNGPSATYLIYFDLDCDDTNGYGGYGQGGEVAIGLEWKVNGPWEVIKFTYPNTNPEVIGNAYVGESVCGDPASQGRFAEFCFQLGDVINSGYDPCACSTIGVPGIVTLAGGDINSQPKDFNDFPVDVDITINNPPTIDATVMPTAICLGESITFDASASFDTVPSNDTLYYCWDFDFVGTTIDCESTDIVGSHTYTATGAYQVALEIRDRFDCADTLTWAVAVYAAPEANFNITFDECDLQIVYDGSGSIDNTLADNLIFNWDFGDGNTSTTESGTHTFNSCGTFDVTLIVEDPNAQPPCNTDTLTQTLVF